MTNVFNRFNKNFSHETQSFNNNVKNSDYFTSEFEINDAPVGARNLLTKGFVQDKINHHSGAAITTRGRFISKNDHQKNPLDRPLYLFIQGPTKQSIELAIQKIHEIIRNDIGNPIRQATNPPTQGNTRTTMPTTQPSLKPPALMGVSTNVTQVEKLYIGLDGVPASFDLRGKIIGPNGSNLHYIRSETGAAVTLRGRGSQFIEAALGREGPDPLHLYLEHPRPEGLATARQLAVNLVETLVQELQQTDFPQQQIMSSPPQMSMPPPPQQHMTAPPQFSVEHPWLINTQNNQSAGHQMGVSGQQFQLQQVVLQPPPRPCTHVNIPPPGVHIPQHAGPLVPPPQLVQLSAPPPTGPNAPPVLVVGHPPPQPLYLPPDMVASSSLGTFSLVQGGLVYHQAPPVQTQAQIGESQIMNSRQNEGNISINPHSQPPPQMIITQIQIDPNSQIINSNDQMSQNFRNHQKYHVIGQIQNQINRDDSNQSQQIIQNQDTQNENFNNYSNQTSSIINSPYQGNTGNNLNTSSDGEQDQIQIRQGNQQSDQDGKPGSRQMGMFEQGKQDNQRGQSNMQMQLSQNQIQINPPTNNSDNRLSHANFGQIRTNRPPNQFSDAPPSNQVSNNQYQNQQGVDQNQQNFLNMSQQSNQDNNQIINNQQQMRQMPPNQFSSDSNQQQMNSQNQQQVNMQVFSQDGQQHQINQHSQNQRNFNQPFGSTQNEPSRQEPRRHDNQRSRSSNQGGRSRRGPRNSRQYQHPWSRSDQDRPNQQTDPVWQRKESIREFEYERKVNDMQRNEGRQSRFQPLEEDIKPQPDENQQYRGFDGDQGQQENMSRSNQVSGNQSGQRNTFAQQYGQGESKPSQLVQSNRNRNESDHMRNERSPEGGQKRKFEQEGAWGNRSDSKKSSPDVGKSSHKKRFDQDDYKSGAAGSQNSGKSSGSKSFKPSDSTKGDKNSSSKWGDSGSASEKDEFEMKKEDHDEKSPCKNEKSTEPSSEKSGTVANGNQIMQQPAPWTDQRTEYKGNAVQYNSTGQFQGQPAPMGGDNMANRQFQQNYQPYINATQMFQGNLPYHLLPPPPPPPGGQSQNNSMQIQPSMQFNLPQGNNTPPNMLMGNSSMNQAFGQNPLAMPNVTQSMPPNMNMGQNIHQNSQYDMSQNMMNNLAQQHHMVPNNYIMPPNMPPGMNQNIPMNIAQNVHPNVGQNMSPNMGQIMPNHMQAMNQNIGQNITQNMGQHMMPNMGQSPSSYIGHNVPSNMQHNLGQNMMSPNMGQGAPANPAQNIQPNMNQNMGQGMPSMMGNNNQSMPMNVPNNNQHMGMSMQSMVHNMGPSMVPPPSSGPPPMMPPARPHIAPPPPPPNVHNMTSQPPYPYWVN